MDPLGDPGRERRAEQRARELLRSCVNDEEWAMYRDLGFIRVAGALSRRTGDTDTEGPAYAYLVYAHKPIVAYVPASGRLLSEYCVEFPDLTGQRRPLAPAGLRRRAGQVDGAHLRRVAGDRAGQHAPGGPPAGPGPGQARPVAAGGVGAPPQPRDARRVSIDPRRRSRVQLEGPDRAAARAYLKGIGYSADDLRKPIVGIANTWTETMPCNFHLRGLAERVKEGVRAAGGTPMEFNTVAISDGITMGTQGMKTSLVSREVIADSIELVARGHLFDGVVALSGCDKTIPGCVMALARLDVPGLMLYGGSISPGRWRGKDVTIQDVFEAVGAHAAGDMSDEDLEDLEDHASPGPGACGGQFTANTMAMAFEVLGISPGASAMVPAEDATKGDVAEACGRLVMDLVNADRRPSAVITKDGLENAIAAAAMSGGSTNVVLHLLAVAKEAGVELDIDDFDRIAWSTPLLADLKPGGRFVATDLYAAGGVPLVVKRLKEGGFLKEDALTVTGADRGRAGRQRRGGRGPGGRAAAGRPAQAQRRLRDPARQPRPGGLRGQAQRPRPPRAPRARRGCSSARRTPSPRSRPRRSRRAT